MKMLLLRCMRPQLAQGGLPLAAQYFRQFTRLLETHPTYAGKR
jgi:hypothetical protein